MIFLNGDFLRILAMSGSQYHSVLIFLLNASQQAELFNCVFHKMKMLGLIQDISILVSGAFLKCLSI